MNKTMTIASIACFLLCLVLTKGSRSADKTDYIEGTVASARGPEAGVWVIAETSDLPTRYAKIVVTDDRGRYVIPQLPKANYSVWVRGYGLVDSARVAAIPGQHLDLKAVLAPDGRAAAQVYPANYWLSLLEIPKGDLSVTEVVGTLKGCLQCHQIGDRATREIFDTTRNLGKFSSSLEVWDRRTKSGPAGAAMSGTFMGLGDQRRMFADWTDQIAAGDYPKDGPPRPKGIERNLVITEWDWGTPVSYMHDEAASDSRNPMVNANGPVYGIVNSEDLLVWLDPNKNEVGQIKVPSQAPPAGSMFAPSPYWGSENIWRNAASPRSLAMDEKGRAWFAAAIRGKQQPGFCQDGLANRFAHYFPLPNPSVKQVAYYDPKTKQITGIDTCFSADHNEFAPDGSLFFGQTNAIGWVNTKTYDETRSDEVSQGWAPVVLDTNGDGKITKPWTEPEEPVDPTKDHRIDFPCYSISSSPIDGSAWCSGIGPRTHTLVRLERGSNPPETVKGEIYIPPENLELPFFAAGGVDTDSNGVAWQNWRGNDYITGFDRRRCKTLNGPTATGSQCPEGWMTYRNQEPTFRGGTKIHSDLNYLIFVDRHGVLGLGKDVPMTGAVNSDAVLVLIPRTGQFVTLRIPYPMGYYPRSMQGRIDDPRSGWKGRGFWTSYNTYTPWHIEGGKGTKDKVVKLQLRPDPLAK